MSIIGHIGRCHTCGHDHSQILFHTQSSLGWIRCAEALPDNDTFVLIWNGGPAHEAWFIVEEDDGTFRDALDCGEYSGVTHWMPLPEGPK